MSMWLGAHSPLFCSLPVSVDKLHTPQRASGETLMTKVGILTTAFSCAILTVALTAQSRLETPPPRLKAGGPPRMGGAPPAAPAQAGAPGATAAPAAPGATGTPRAPGAGGQGNLIPYPTTPYEAVG